MAERSRVEAIVHEKVAAVLQSPATKFDADATLESIGIDSILALELLVSLESALQVTLPTELDMQPPISSRSTLGEIVALVEGVVGEAPGDRRQ